MSSGGGDGGFAGDAGAGSERREVLGAAGARVDGVGDCQCARGDPASTVAAAPLPLAACTSGACCAGAGARGSRTATRRRAGAPSWVAAELVLGRTAAASGTVSGRVGATTW